MEGYSFLIARESYQLRVQLIAVICGNKYEALTLLLIVANFPGKTTKTILTE